MSFRNKINERLEELRTASGEERGISIVELTISIAIMFALACLGIMGYDLLTHSQEEQEMAGEATTAYNVIYGSYSERAQSDEDKDELNEVLEEATKLYKERALDGDTQVTSELIDEKNISVTVSRYDSDSERLFTGTMETGDDDPSVSSEKLSSKNEVRELNLNFSDKR